LGFPIIAADYPMPNDVDALTMRKWAEDHFRAVHKKYSNSKIILAGDSAGANMALALAQQLGEKAPNMIDVLYSLYGWLDLSRERSDYPDNYEEVLLDSELTPDAAARFYGDIDAKDPRISPLFGDMDHLPLVRIITADKDMLHEDSLELDQRLKAAGKNVSYKCYEKYAHDFWLLPTPDGRRALRELAAMMRADVVS